jgi:hypothetical protein
MRKTRNALLGILTMMSGAILAVPTEAQNDIFLASTKGCQSDFSVIPMGAPISRRRSAHSAIPTSTPTTGVTTPLDTTTTTGITILLTIGNTALQPAVPAAPAARPIGSK